MGKFISTFKAFFGLVLVNITFTSQATQAQDIASLKELIESHYKAINTEEDRLKTCGSSAQSGYMKMGSSVRLITMNLHY